MSQISSIFGNLPGIGTPNYTYEAEITFGIAAQMKWWNGWIDANAVDSGNSPTWRLRPGLVMGQITSTGRWTNYSATATDGSEVASGILAYGMRMQDVLTGSNVQKFYAIVVGGNVHSANLLGLDLMARNQMKTRFTFDDNLVNPDAWYPFPRFQAKTTDYTIVAADNGTNFTNQGATGTVVFTLPAIANGYSFGFRAIADYALQVNSAEGSNIVAYNNAARSSLAFSTGSQIIGGGLRIYSNPAGTLWIAENTSAGANTVSAA